MIFGLADCFVGVLAVCLCVLLVKTGVVPSLCVVVYCWSGGCISFNLRSVLQSSPLFVMATRPVGDSLELELCSNAVPRNTKAATEWGIRIFTKSVH